MVTNARRCRAPHHEGFRPYPESLTENAANGIGLSNKTRHALHSGPASPARAHAIVPGIHVLAALKQERRGWPGHLARRRASRFCPAMTKRRIIFKWVRKTQKCWLHFKSDSRAAHPPIPHSKEATHALRHPG